MYLFRNIEPKDTYVKDMKIFHLFYLQGKNVYFHLQHFLTYLCRIRVYINYILFINMYPIWSVFMTTVNCEYSSFSISYVTFDLIQ